MREPPGSIAAHLRARDGAPDRAVVLADQQLRGAAIPGHRAATVSASGAHAQVDHAAGTGCAIGNSGGVECDVPVRRTTAERASEPADETGDGVGGGPGGRKLLGWAALSQVLCPDRALAAGRREDKWDRRSVFRLQLRALRRQTQKTMSVPPGVGELVGVRDQLEVRPAGKVRAPVARPLGISADAQEQYRDSGSHRPRRHAPVARRRHHQRAGRRTRRHALQATRALGRPDGDQLVHRQCGGTGFGALAAVDARDVSRRMRSGLASAARPISAP